MMPGASKSQKPAQEIICRYSPQAERVRLWESINDPVPESMRVGWTCKVAYCEKLDHMCLVERKNLHWRDYAPYVRAVAKLKPGQSCILRDVPNSGNEAAKFRCAMYARKELMGGRYLYRAVPGGMRITCEVKARRPG
jgi:hypothetical protein